LHVVILATSHGNALRPLTSQLPQALVPIGQKRFIEFQIEYMAAQQFFEFVVVITPPKGTLIREYLGSGARFGVDIAYAEEKEPLGTGGCLSLLTTHVDDRFVLLGADSFLPIDYRLLARAERDECIVAACSNKDKLLPNNLRLAGDLVIDAGAPSEKMTHLYAGACVLTHDVPKHIPKEAASIEEAVFRPLIRSSRLRAHAVRQRPYFIHTPTGLNGFCNALKKAAWARI